MRGLLHAAAAAPASVGSGGVRVGQVTHSSVSISPVSGKRVVYGVLCCAVLRWATSQRRCRYHKIIGLNKLQTNKIFPYEFFTTKIKS